MPSDRVKSGHAIRSDGHCGLEEVVATELLSTRVSREPDYVAENEALLGLATALSETPETILQKLVDAALRLCGAGSAGISVLERGRDGELFRWHATAGAFAKYAGGTIPRADSPCGVVMDRNKPQLMTDIVRHYTYLADVDPPLLEALLVPFHEGEVPIGTVWVVSHTAEKQFDAEDARLVGSVAKFAAAAVRTLSHLKALESANESLRREAAERAKVEASLREARDAAETANRAKDKFLAVLSHELRTPLSPVVMTIPPIEQDPELPAKFREDLAMIRRNIDLEVKLIDDLLDLSRVANGKLRLRMERVRVRELLRHVVRSVRNDLQEKSLEIHEEYGAGGDEVAGDPARLQQVFGNVLRNAVKFTPAGGRIDVRTWTAAGHGAGKGRLVVEIRDSGAGIPPELLPRIFDAFEQGNAPLTRQFGGLGLGLAIAKAIVEIHGGTIKAASSGNGRGATFTVELETVEAGDRGERAAAGDDARKCDGVRRPRVLLVEDHADTARTMARLLQGTGFDVTLAGSVAAALAVAAEQEFDVVVSDIGLPDATGYELMRALGERYGIRGIALSGYGMEEDVRQAREAGFSEHLVKPVNIGQLTDMLRRVVER